MNAPLIAIRRELAVPFADPITLTRAEARAIERALSSKAGRVNSFHAAIPTHERQRNHA